MTLLSLLECEGIFDLGLWALQVVAPLTSPRASTPGRLVHVLIPPPWALQSFGPLLYDIYNDGKLHQLPFITEELFDTPLAGIDDMATVVSPARAQRSNL